MNKILGAGAAALMTVTVLAGCGGGGSSGGSGGGYCDDLKSTKATVTSLGDNADLSQATFEKLTASVHTIADEAPSDIKGDWNNVGDALDKVSSALHAAGISFDDLKDLGQAGAPSIDPAKLQALEDASKSLDQDALSASSDKINAEVKSECGFNLGFGS
jgi:ABC-type glycerol-3-phosphate transport system substrate-binding protein